MWQDPKSQFFDLTADDNRLFRSSIIDPDIAIGGELRSQEEDSSASLDYDEESPTLAEALQEDWFAHEFTPAPHQDPHDALTQAKNARDQPATAHAFPFRRPDDAEVAFPSPSSTPPLNERKCEPGCGMTPRALFSFARPSLTNALLRDLPMTNRSRQPLIIGTMVGRKDPSSIEDIAMHKLLQNISPSHDLIKAIMTTPPTRPRLTTKSLLISCTTRNAVSLFGPNFLRMVMLYSNLLCTTPSLSTSSSLRSPTTPQLIPYRNSSLTLRPPPMSNAWTLD